MGNFNAKQWSLVNLIPGDRLEHPIFPRISGEGKSRVVATECAVGIVEKSCLGPLRGLT